MPPFRYPKASSAETLVLSPSNLDFPYTFALLFLLRSLCGSYARLVPCDLQQFPTLVHHCRLTLKHATCNNTAIATATSIIISSYSNSNSRQTISMTFKHPQAISNGSNSKQQQQPHLDRN
ncbi:unnamed protein product [Ceratitis capitata]|uniref:(Mediterranean fruit fly) hypothetical protein n=1 Tax=Ceratitis capitata TaxID=7213 RepID=A0A811UN97_CERCA|nr:unnamed protein product [Ceratitis capitata]